MALRWLEPHHDGAISGRAMLEAIVKGEHDSHQLAELSRGLLRNKMAQLQQALEGRVTAHHRFLLRELLDHLYFVEPKMRRIEQKVEERLRPFQSGGDWTEHEPVRCATLGQLGGALPRQS